MYWLALTLIASPGSHWLKLAHLDSPRIILALSGPPWLFLAHINSPWLSLGIHGYPRISPYLPGSHQLSPALDLPGSPRLSPAHANSPQLSTTIRGFLIFPRLSQAFTGFHWFSPALPHSPRLSPVLPGSPRLSSSLVCYNQFSLTPVDSPRLSSNITGLHWLSLALLIYCRIFSALFIFLSALFGMSHLLAPSKGCT